MLNLIIRRLIQTVIVVFLVTIIAFLLMHIIPGDPAAMILGTDVEPEEVELLRHELGLDLPIHLQYIRWIGNILQGDFGKSLIYNQDVMQLIKERVPITLYLSGWAFITSIVFGLLAGIISAVRRGSLLDNIVTLLANIGVAIPVFWLGICGIYILGLNLGWLPIQGYTSPFDDFVKSSKQAIMPIICLAAPFMAVMARQTRSNMLEVIRQDYIRTALSKGLRERVVVFGHALKNALIPVITLIGMHVRVLIGGSVLVEQVFNIPGMGRLIVTAAFDKDYLVVQSCIIVMSLITCLSNLAVEISYIWIDPRIRYE